MIARLLFTAALLWPLTGYAAAPTVSNNGTCTSALGVSTLACSVTTTGTNKIVVLTVATQNTSATARTVSSVTDNGSAGLTFVLAPNARKNASTVCLAGSINPCALNVEQWWALAASALTTESLTVNLSGSATVVIGGWKGVAGVFNTAAPFDTDVSLAALNNGGSATVPTTGTFSTLATDTLLVDDTVVGRNQTGWVPCSIGTFGSWATTFAEISFTSQIELSERGQGVTSLQSSVSGHKSTSGSGACPAGTSTASGDGWLSLTTAMSGTGPAFTNRPLIHQVPWMMGR